MSIQSIQSDLLVDLSTDEQQLLSGGKAGFIRARGTFRYAGKKYPLALVGIVRDLPGDDKDKED